jgi:hypothetical protein
MAFQVTNDLLGETRHEKWPLAGPSFDSSGRIRCQHELRLRMTTVPSGILFLTVTVRQSSPPTVARSR